MILTVENLVTILRESVNVQSKEAEVIDPAFLAMTDDELKLFIKLGVSRAYPEVTDLEFLEDGSEYPIILLAKIELYLKLAVLRADKVNLSADGASISLSDRFQHYMELVQEAREQYSSWLENESLNGTLVTSHNLLIDKNYYSQRTYDIATAPKVVIHLGTVTNNSVDVAWVVSKFNHFGRYKLYISEGEIIDPYKDKDYFTHNINENATLVKSTADIRNNSHRIEGLKSNTEYHIAVLAIERNAVFGYKEITFTTLEEIVEEDVDITDISSEVSE